MSVGRAAYEPGWRWSEHVGAALGKASCDVAHIGVVLSGRNRIEMDDGRVFEIGPGDLFEIGPGHDPDGEARLQPRDPPYPRRHAQGLGVRRRKSGEAGIGGEEATEMAIDNRATVTP